MNKVGLAVLLLFAAAPASAQYVSAKSDFAKAIHARDGNKVIQLLNDNPPGLVDARDNDGNTPLIVTINRKDEWASFLLGKGADPNLPGKGGDTPMIAAARVGYMEAIEWLLGVGAKVDTPNRMGETPLIVAVQQRQARAVRRLARFTGVPNQSPHRCTA